MMHPLDEALALQEKAPGQYVARTHLGYANAVGPFGGVTAGQLLMAALRHPERSGEPVAQTVHFAAPVGEGEFELSAQPVRTNRSTQHWLIQAYQQGEVVAMATAVFAVRRDSWSAIDASFPDSVPEVAAVPPFEAPQLPEFTRRYDLRYFKGLLTKSGQEQDNAESALWVRDEPGRPLDFPSLAALCDVFFPRLMVRRQRAMRIGTVTMTSYFHADSAMLADVGEQHVLGVARGHAYRRGYFDQSAEIWSPTQELLATTHQMVYFKDV